MNKLEVGMYVRTKDGYIAKCIYYDNELGNFYGFDSVVRKSFSDTYDFIYCNEEKYITKTSHNIIDLIEVGDYVNGEKVYYCYCADEDSSGLYINMSKARIWLNKPSQIKSIVTKEQFFSMEYKVGGNNE